jgi:hypothetical protein
VLVESAAEIEVRHAGEVTKRYEYILMSRTASMNLSSDLELVITTSGDACSKTDLVNKS